MSKKFGFDWQVFSYLLPEHDEYETKDDTNNNQGGRIKHITDESGDEWCYYGKVGEVTKEQRKIGLLAQIGINETPDFADGKSSSCWM